MKMFLISDNVDTLVGMRLSGVDGVVMHERGEVEAKLRELLSADNDSRLSASKAGNQKSKYGVVLITEKLRNMCGGLIDPYLISNGKTLVSVIPDRHGFGRSKTAVMDYVRSSIGLQL